MTDRDGPLRSGTRAHGFTLIEVVVAIVLLAVVIGPICGSLLALASRAAALSSDSAVEAGSLDTARDDWRWSEVEVDDARWNGATINVEVRAAPGPDPIEVGWWVDGWFSGSLEGMGSASFGVNPPVGGWPAEARWLTVRARRSPDPWGVAWRMALPSAAGASGDSLSAPARLLTDEPTVDVSSVVVLHNLGAGLADVRLGSNSAPAIELSPEGATALLLSPGSLDLYCDGALQSLTLENGDVVHLYF